MSNPIEALQRLERAGQLLRERRPDPVTGKTWGALDESLQLRDKAAGYIRSDSPAKETTEHTVLFLRSLFSGEDGVPLWVGDGRGRTDPRKSDVTVESVLARQDREIDLSKLNVLVQPGPGGGGGLMRGSTLKHIDFASGTRTYTDLIAGSIQVNVMHPEPPIAIEIAEFIGRNLRIMADRFCTRKLHAINNVTVGTYDPNQRASAQRAQNAQYIVIPVSFAYYYQWTARVSPREGVYETARAMRTQVHDETTGITRDLYSLTTGDFGETDEE